MYAGCMVYQGWHVMKVDGFTKGELIQSHREVGRERYNHICGKAKYRCCMRGQLTHSSNEAKPMTTGDRLMRVKLG